MTTVFNQRFGINPSLTRPTDEDWQTVRKGVDGLKGDVAGVVAQRLGKAAADGKVTRDEYFSGHDVKVAGFTVGRGTDSVQGAMTADVTALGLRAGKVDTFDVAALRGVLGNKGVTLDPAVRKDMEARVQAYDADLRGGEVKTGTHVDAQGGVHELTEGRIDVDYNAFIARMNPADWSPNLARYRGGEVRDLGSTRRPDGTLEYRQQERMSIDRFPNNLDMTKNSIVEINQEGAKVSWHVFHSDPTALTLKTASVMKDDGFIEFKKDTDGKVLVRCHSVHQVSTPGTQLARFVMGQDLANQLTGQLGLAGYFKDVVLRYRDIGEGRAPVVDTHREHS